jgi:Copper transport outer membrane protein, MctB
VIDFRYHLVSIVAVFLALAIGIVLGSTELQGPVYSALSHTTSSLENQLTNADSQRDAAQQGLNADNAMLSAGEAWDVRNMLNGQRVVVFTEPNAQPSVITGITTALKDAGATVTGQVNLEQKFFDGSNATAASIEATNTQIASSDGISLDSGLSDQQQATAQVLAAEILTKSASASSAGIQATSSSQPAQAQTALQAYATEGFLTTSGQPATPATLAVVVTPQVIPADGTADPLAQVLGPFAQELAKASSGTVVAGSQAASGAGSPIAELRATSVTSQVSSVDDADSVRGQISVVSALYSTLTGGPAVSYGVIAGTYPSLNPSVTPSPSPSPSPSASSSTTKKPRK